METYSGDLERDLSGIRLVRDAEAICHTLSETTKMPGWSYNLPASKCLIGSKLRHVPGTTCFKCYAADTTEWVRQKTIANGRWTSSRYSFPNVQDAMAKRFASLEHPLWVPAIVWLIRYRCTRSQKFYFRWHDSGDLQSGNHLRNMMIASAACPDVRFWLPTREYSIVRDYLRECVVPKNVCMRLSAHFVDGKPPQLLKGIQTSTVSTGDKPAHGGRRCPAPLQGNSCGECRSCWNRRVRNVDYHEH